MPIKLFNGEHLEIILDVEGTIHVDAAALAGFGSINEAADKLRGLASECAQAIEAMERLRGEPTTSLP